MTGMTEMLADYVGKESWILSSSFKKLEGSVSQSVGVTRKHNILHWITLP